MELKDTPNPHAKKIIVNHNFEIAIYLDEEKLSNHNSLLSIFKLDGVKSIFTGPGFLTISKEEKTDWSSIIEDIKNNLDKI